MAVDIKVPPDEKLELVQTYITDTNPNSDYFNISELPDTFSGGKNAFLIAGSVKLLANTEIKIQIRDAAGKVCYVEYSNGNPEYYEGNSKVAAVYIYPTLTAFGPATITILGQLKDVPQEWNGLYSVKWERQVNINPALANTTRVRLYKRPTVSIKELLQPLYAIVSGSKVASIVTQSFASITINQLETFAGDVARVKVYRTSAGDIADYELIQDISIESKNLLTTYALSGSVIGNAGLFGPDTLSKVWNTSSLHAVLDSTHVADGLQLTGSGTFRFTSSLSLLSTNTYNLELDTFYTGSTPTNLVAYIRGSGSAIYPIAVFSGSIPTKNFGTTITPFTILNDAPTASLYFSQSSGTNQWHVGNISLNLSQDTAFSPNEISFITSMPTVLGNETFNFKFELYDINNNYVPIALTSSVLFNGGNNNIGGTLILISGSTSSSNASILALSQSVSGTIGIVTGSVSQSFYTSSLYSASLQSSSLYISSSLSSSISSSKGAAISSSFGNIQTLANGKFSGSFINDTTVFAPVIGGNNGYISDLFKVGTTPSIYLDARQNPRKIFIGGVADVGSYNSASTTVYMDSSGKFSLGDKLTWSGTTLTLAGSINITGGQAATDIANAALSGSNAQSTANSAASAASTAATAASTAATAASTAAAAANYALINANTSSISAAAAAAGFALINANTASIFTDTSGKVNRAPSTGVAGLYLGDSYMGYHNGNGLTSGWKTYMQNNGNFYLSGTAGYLSWNAGADTLGIKGDIIATNITATTAGNIAGWGIDGSRFFKTTASGKVEIKSSDNTISMYDPSDNLRLQINPSTTLPTFASPTTTTTINALAGITLDAGSGVTAYNMEGPGVAGSDTADSTAVSIVLSGALNEIYIEDIASRWYDVGGTVSDNLGYFFFRLSGSGNMWNIKYTMTGILSGPSGTFSTILGYAYGSWNDNSAFYEWYNGSIYTNPAVFSNLAAGTYTFKIRHDMSWGKIFGTAVLRWFPWANHPIGTDRIESTGNANINITYGASTAYSVINAGGVVLYNGSRNIFKVSQPATTDDSFFQVTGKSQFNTSLYVKGALAADSKQFQITHPLNKDKWLYHSAIEGPGAYLIYKGTSELQNGLATASIDLLSNMTSGTFESLVRRSQFFVQNNSSWDLVRGNVNDGVVYIESNNTNSTASVDWMVIGERKDDSILNSVLYDKDGNYKPEKYKSSYFLEYVDYETSGSI